MFYNATDVGFLGFDFQNGLILFEGDNERYRIPASAIVECRQEYCSRFTSTQFLAGYASRSHKERRYFFVVITARFSGRDWELPFRILTGKGFLNQDNQGAANLAFLKEVRRLREPESLN